MNFKFDQNRIYRYSIVSIWILPHFFLDKSKREKKAGKFKLCRHFVHFLCFGFFSFSKLQQSIKNGKKLHKVAMLKLKRINTTQWPKAANVSKEFRRSSLYCIANCDAEMCTKFACKREIIEVSIRIFLLKFSLPVHFIQERKKEEDFFLFR